ncbi:MAG TPA: hypothetical protein VK803_00365 [Steroidobacteraceae bacterium]|jgi:hypothetical protein|nr:hypothetical protein [Steroidobacteraceae bacterium]
MSAVLLAVFNDYPTADRVRTRLVSDGFPTDRVALTATADPGRAGEAPGPSQRAKLRQHFRTLLSEQSERQLVDALVRRVQAGAATVAVQPRGAVESQRAIQILEEAGAAQLVGHDLDNQAFEHAAAHEEGYWVRDLLRGPPAHRR